MTKAFFAALALAASAGLAAAQAPAGIAPPPAGTYQCYLSEKSWTDPKAIRFATLNIDGRNGYRFATRDKPPIDGRYATQPDGTIALLDKDNRTPALSGTYVLDPGGQAVFMMRHAELPKVYMRCGEAETLQSASTQPSVAVRKETPPPRFATAPGQGLKPQQVVGFAQQIEYQGMSYSPLSGSWQGSHRVENYLLLADGSIRNGWPQDLPLEDFDAAASKREEPKLWGRYAARVKPGEGGYYDVTWNNGEQEKLALSFAVPARPGERLRGYFYQVDTASVGVPGNSTFSAAWSGIVFQPDGRFETNSGGSSNHEGSGGSVLATQARSRQGSYRLSGTLLELRFDDGRTERRQFMFTSAEKDWIVVNGTRLLLRK